jgi:hypothetical protein
MVDAAGSAIAEPLVVAAVVLAAPSAVTLTLLFLPGCQMHCSFFSPVTVVLRVANYKLNINIPPVAPMARGVCIGRKPVSYSYQFFSIFK